MGCPSGESKRKHEKNKQTNKKELVVRWRISHNDNLNSFANLINSLHKFSLIGWNDLLLPWEHVGWWEPLEGETEEWRTAEMISLMGRQSACGSERCPELTQPRWRVSQLQWPAANVGVQDRALQQFCSHWLLPLSRMKFKKYPPRLLI